MNTMNELLQMTQYMSTAQTPRTVKADSGQKTRSDGASGFDKLMKDRAQADGEKASPEQTKIGTSAKTDAVGQSKDQADQANPKDETLKEVAAAMAVYPVPGRTDTGSNALFPKPGRKAPAVGTDASGPRAVSGGGPGGGNVSSSGCHRQSNHAFAGAERRRGVGMDRGGNRRFAG